jgi:hypothetical protein
MSETITTDTPAAQLRAAAKLMRERAGKATPGPWKHMCLGSEGCTTIRDSGTIRERGRGRVAMHGWKDWQADHADAEFVAMMSPPVALLLADLLEDEARLEFGAMPDTPLLLARAILGVPEEAERAIRAQLGESQ